MNEAQIKAVESVRRALEKAGKTGLSGGVYDGSFVLFPTTEDRESIVKLLCHGEECNGVDLHTPSIDLDGGAGV